MNQYFRRARVGLVIFSGWLIFSVGRPALANVVGADTQNFNPITSGLDFVTVHSSETLKPGIFNFGLFLNYAVNSLPNYEDIQNASRTNFADSLLSADLNVGVGLLRNWDFGVSVPMLLAQDIDSDVVGFRGEFAENGMTEVRLNTKYRFWGDDRQGVAAVFSANFNQIEDNPFAGENPGPTLNLELVGDRTFGRWAVGANVGYRWRSPGDPIPGVPVEPLKNQYIASLATSYLLREHDIKLIGELFGSLPAESSEFASDRELSSLEALLGMKMDVTHSLAWHLGGGTEVIHGTSSPDWRVYTGLNYTIGPLFGRPKQPILRVDDHGLNDADIDPFSLKPEAQESFLAMDVQFKFDSDEVQPQFRQVLRRLKDYLEQPPGYKTLVVVGHTDSVGSADYNRELSLRRARSVRATLISLGLSADQVSARGLGEEQPIADNGNFQGRAQNRRVEFQVER